MKKQFGKYFLGLDMGTNSVGWAVTDEEYHLQKINGKSMWGIHLFESGNTAAERRLIRTARRRRDRQIQRIKLLQELFSEEITKIDPGFFLRMKDSFFLKEDKSEPQTNTLFNDRNYTDKEYHKEYPTIYHLRLALINGKQIKDPRLLYLAIAHIIKNRGHFLFDGLNPDEIGNSFPEVLQNMIDCLEQEVALSISVNDPRKIEIILRSNELKANEKVKKLFDVIQTEDNDAVKEVFSLLTGGKGSLVNLFNDSSIEETKYKKISLSDLDIDNDSSEDASLEDILQDRIVVLESIKAVADWLTLADILNGKNNLSEAKVDVYEKHKNDLKILKKTVKKYAPEKYYDLFVSPNTENNYPAYVQMTKKNGKKQVVSAKSCSQADFCKFVNKIISPFPEDEKNVQYLLQEASNGKLLPRQKSKNNAVIPYQLNEKELRIILKKAAVQFPFLSQKDDDGYSVSEKIILLLTFRIPYYIGPLNDAHKDSSGHCWIVKKESGAIRPWNFDRKVDKDQSAEQFIRRMTNKCSYLAGEDVLPKNSLLYSKYMVLDELNNLKLDGISVQPVIKKKIYDDVFMRHYRVTGSILRKYLRSEGLITKDTELSGFDGDFKASLKPWLDFKSILNGRPMNEPLIEEIIETITLFSGTDILLTRLKKLCVGKFSDEEISKISKLKYKDWGRFSRKFLTGIYHTDKSTGECKSFIEMMENTCCNHMELLSSSYDFLDNIRRYNSEINGINRGISYERLNDLYVSPSVRRSLWRTLSIVREIRKIMGHDPEKVFIEVPRGEGEKVRTVTRKKQIEQLYSKCKEITPELKEMLGTKNDNELRSDRLFLYFIQQGKCMYSGETIKIEQLYDKNIYDIDHIYPRSLTKDDSVLNNKVLCLRTINDTKSDNYPLAPEIQQKMTAFWLMLKNHNLITDEKYNRLIRKTELTYDELGGFISRQIVETGQACKAAAEILREVFPDSGIVYSKPGNVDQFRQQFDLVKVRELNDLHHAKDAYLNIVVGNIFDTKFTRDPRNFFAQKDHKYNLEKIFNYDVVCNGKYAWHAPGKNGLGSLENVKKTIEKNNVLFTRYSYTKNGKLFKINPVPYEKAQFPIKTSDPRFSKTDNNNNLIYGGYVEVAGSYAFLVEHRKKGKSVRTIEFVLNYCKENIENGKMTLEKYAETILGLDSPRVLIDHINIDSLLVINGFPVHLSGRSKNNLIVKSALQFFLSKENTIYFKKVTKYFNEHEVNANLLLTERNGISKEENAKLYDYIKKKYESDPYQKEFSAYVNLMEKEKDTFLNLSIEDQCLILYKLVALSRCMSVRLDLSKINGPKEIGRITKSKIISNQKSALLIYQSVTGIFEKVIDLLAI